LESPLVCRLRGLLRACVPRSCSVEHTLPTCISRQLAETGNRWDSTAKQFFPLREFSAGKRSCGKVRDREDAIASTRSARTQAGKLCAPQSVQRSSCVFDERSD
jgi:hypothetical protein